jgi:F-box interacting protein
VCNPASEKWVMLPDGSWASGEVRTARLGFDPAASSHFHVVEYVEDEDEYITGVDIYSSKTGSWSSSESEWSDNARLCDGSRSVFLNGIMHSLVFRNEIVAVDMEGKRWRTIPTPPSDNFGFIHQAHGHLLFFDMDHNEANKLLVWILEDYDTDEWIVKYTISTLGLFGGKKLRFDFDYQVIAVHPESNLVFFVYGWDNTLMAYEMGCREVCVIRNLGTDSRGPYLPYVPFSDSLADEH